jgi:hypothetical protein
LLQEAQAAGQIRTDIAAATLNDLVHGLLLTLLDQYAARPNATSLDEQIRIVWAFISTGLSKPEVRP